MRLSDGRVLGSGSNSHYQLSKQIPMKQVNMFTELQELNSQFVSSIAASNFSLGQSVNGTLLVWGHPSNNGFLMKKFMNQEFEKCELRCGYNFGVVRSQQNLLMQIGSLFGDREHKITIKPVEKVGNRGVVSHVACGKQFIVALGRDKELDDPLQKSKYKEMIGLVENKRV
mmetsp:Transcript_549/g.591  ORF Transcript_549/g.591 Transcript_549/m.591 type:complete len:171 (+) Transcript_549:203-715(+)